MSLVIPNFSDRQTGIRENHNLPAVRDYDNRTMAVTAFARVARLPEITLPLGLSLCAAHYQDEFLLEAAARLWGEHFATA